MYAGTVGREIEDLGFWKENFVHSSISEKEYLPQTRDGQYFDYHDNRD